MTNPTHSSLQRDSADATVLFQKVSVATTLALLSATAASHGSADYGPAIWRPICNANWYTTGYGKKFYVVHDMEGYYASVLSTFASCSFRSASVHYAINGKKDAASDYAPGEVTQLGVADANYAWHACCWNQHSMGTEHEGFASNPAWYTPELYQSSALLTRSKCDKYGFAKDRNHIVAHGEKSNSAWVSWAGPNLGINATCQTHTDPGPYWDWNGYMNLVRGSTASAWTFNSGTDNWVSGNSLTPQIWNGSGWPGIIYADQTGDDAYVFGEVTSFAGKADASVSVRVYPQSGNSANHDMQVFWSTAAEPGMDAAKSSPTVSYRRQNDWIQLNLNVSSAKWSGQTIRQLRLDYDGLNKGTRWILDSVITQVTPKWWFGSSPSGWTLGNGLVNLGWISDATWPGCIYADQNGNDAFFYSPDNLGYRGGANDQIVIRLFTQASSSSSHDIQVFWKTFWDPTWTESKSKYLTYTLADSTWGIITIPVGANPLWSADDYIMQLRLDVDNTSKGNRWIVDYVAVSQTASSFLP